MQVSVDREGVVSVPTAALRGHRIAVVDDAPGVLAGLRRILNASGLDAELFASAEALLARGSLNDLSCLVIDIHLGGMSGFDLRRRLTEDGSTIPVIFITACDDEATRLEAMNAGCAAYLCKPFPGHALIDAITNAAGGANDAHRRARIPDNPSDKQ